MKDLNAEIKKIHYILEEPLMIPEYQRPYRWQNENVRLLLQDIYDSWKQGKSAYRVGSIILHIENKNANDKAVEDDEKDVIYNIVDGQQRITTILLILKALKSNLSKLLASTLNYHNIDSKNSIVSNFKFIENWVAENLGSEQGDFCKYVTDYCEFVVIEITNLSEAFQMFDSQNSKGKELETYNLLKAYHIRAMESDLPEIKIACDRRWEDATRFNKDKDVNHKGSDILKQIFNEQLYRTRVWSKKESAFKFDRKKISEFKGLTINKFHPISHSFQNNELLLFTVQNYFASIGVEIKGIKNRFNNADLENINPFVLVNQNIINGKPFFDYIETYTELYKQLFVFNDEYTNLEEFKKFYQTHCNYKGSHREGDKYLNELYKSLVFLVFDKYGEVGLNKYYKTLYALVYRLRLEKFQVKYAFVAEYPIANDLFSIIDQSRSFLDFQLLESKAKVQIECKKNVAEIIPFFNSYGVTINYL